MISLEELGKMVDFMRARGVTLLEAGDVTLELGPEPRGPAIAESIVDKPEKVKQSRKGPDGLTAEEQMDFYGRVLDSELRED